MPGEEFVTGPESRIHGDMDFISMESFIILPIVKFLPNSLADFEVVVS